MMMTVGRFADGSPSHSSRPRVAEGGTKGLGNRLGCAFKTALLGRAKSFSPTPADQKYWSLCPSIAVPPR